MKAIIFTLLTTAASLANASGTLMLEPRYNPETKSTYIVAGLATKSKLWGPVGYSSWTGLGDKANGIDYSNWYVTKHQLDFKIMSVTLSPGVRFGYSEKFGSFGLDKIEVEYFGKIAAPLW